VQGERLLIVSNEGWSGAERPEDTALRIDLEKVIRFSVIAEHGSYTAAARLLRVDQPWLSRQIKQLEEQLGFSLFERTTRRVALTPHGETFLSQAQAVAKLARETDLVADTLRRETAGSIRIGVFRTSFWSRSRFQLLDLFERRTSHGAIDLVMDHTPQLLLALEAREIDAVLGTASEGGERFDRLLLERVTPQIVIPEEHPLASRDAVHMRDLAGCSLATGDMELNQVNFEMTYGPFRAAGMVLRPVVEGKVAIGHYSRRERLFMLSYGDVQEVDSEQGMATRPILDTTSRVEIWIYRNPGNDGELLRRLWSIAGQIGQDAEPPVGS